MTLPDWRIPCGTCGGTGQVEGSGPDSLGGRWSFVDQCPTCSTVGFVPITYADLEALGERVYWCVFHDCQGFDAGIGHPYLGYCWEGYYLHDPAIGTLDCRMVVRRLLIPLPAQEVVK